MAYKALTCFGESENHHSHLFSTGGFGPICELYILTIEKPPSKANALMLHACRHHRSPNFFPSPVSFPDLMVKLTSIGNCQNSLPFVINLLTQSLPISSECLLARTINVGKPFSITFSIQKNWDRGAQYCAGCPNKGG